MLRLLLVMSLVSFFSCTTPHKVTVRPDGGEVDSWMVIGRNWDVCDPLVPSCSGILKTELIIRAKKVCRKKVTKVINCEPHGKFEEMICHFQCVQPGKGNLALVPPLAASEVAQTPAVRIANPVLPAPIAKGSTKRRDESSLYYVGGSILVAVGIFVVLKAAYDWDRSESHEGSPCDKPKPEQKAECHEVFEEIARNHEYNRRLGLVGAAIAGAGGWTIGLGQAHRADVGAVNKRHETSPGLFASLSLAF